MKDIVEEIFQQAQLEPALVQEMLRKGRLKELKAGEVLIRSGLSEGFIPMVIQGLLRVIRNNPDGDELFLYYLGDGEACAMSISCCIERKEANIYVEAEIDSSLWILPAEEVQSWIVTYPGFRSFVFNSYQDRFDELLNTIDSFVFQKLDQRLYKYLLDTKQALGTYVIHKTHEQIATSLNTSRVVISRLLKRLEKEGKIEIHRNRIEIL